MRRKTIRSSFLVWLLVAALPALTSVPSASAEADLDPVVLDVIRMLEAGVGEEVIVRWLDSTDRRPVDIGSQGMVGLSEAGASQELLQALLDRLIGPADRESALAPPASGEELAAVIKLAAKRAWTDEDEPDSPRQPLWSVYLYLDGEFVAWTRPTLEGNSTKVSRSLLPGAHELRVVLQRYEEDRDGWSYESRVVPSLITFETVSREPIEVEVDIERIWGLWRHYKGGGPLSWVVRQGGSVLSEQRGTGGNPDRWVAVCEDIEANFEDSSGVPLRYRNAMIRCVPWIELWTGPGRETSRAEILAMLADFDFEPPAQQAE